MGNNGVVSIRVEALGDSITIADGNIAIEQTKTKTPAATVSETETCDGECLLVRVKLARGSAKANGRV